MEKNKIEKAFSIFNGGEGLDHWSYSSTSTPFAKNILGSTTDYQAKAITKFEINKNEIIEKLEVSEKFNYQKVSDNYEEKSYEQTIKRNLASSISQKLILRLSIVK